MIRKLVERAALIEELEAATKEAALKEMLAAAEAAGAFPKSARAGLHNRKVLPEYR